MVDRILTCGRSGRQFRLNFLVVYTTVMCEITKMNTVNMSYTLECLKRTKSKWSGSEYCNAPITFFTMKKGNLCLEHYQQYNTKIQTVSLNYVVDDNVNRGDETVLNKKDNVDEQMDQGLKVDGRYNQLDFKSFKHYQKVQEFQGLKVGDQDEIDHAVDDGLDDGVHKHDCLEIVRKMD
ncbi:hypothetical protein L1987_42205 [Smallanthus sonchifolius]|uniref:Uncharacterized protein n=1 Tax=Smallanthus sonchifolius TaxID=185202 RepID=A0ACB9GVM5_9ASTR|nr:hypothetical protein L1987_42205 [Smallanthus sonchifolius]